MTPADLLSSGADYLWQVTLHSFLASLAVYAWARHLRLPSGRPKRVLLATLLVLPLVTAAVPGRQSAEFRTELAWFDSSRVLALPLAGGLDVAQLVAAAGVLTALVTLWQEVLPTVRRHRRAPRAAPASLVERVRQLPGWEQARVELLAGGELVAAAGGTPWRPRLLLSEELVARLDPASFDAVLRHERAHHRAHRWWSLHALFAARLVQCVNPVALWLFREYSVETEIACDREAAAGRDPRPLGRALLALYEHTSRRDLSARATLRLRIDRLLGRAPAPDDHGIAPSTLAAATALLALLLPWVV